MNQPPQGVPQYPQPLDYRQRDPRPMNGPAIASFVLGLLFFIPILPALGAIILGIVGLRVPESQRRGRGFAIAGVMLGSLTLLFTGLMMALLIPALNNARAVAQQVVCMSNLKQIGQALAMYTGDNRDYLPTDPAALQKYMAPGGPSAATSVFLCPSGSRGGFTVTTADGLLTSYIFLLPQGPQKQAPQSRWGAIPRKSRYVIAYEDPANHPGRGISVLFADWHVDRIDASKAQILITQLEAGQNPPSVPGLP